jgi:hypothetical protein
VVFHTLTLCSSMTEPDDCGGDGMRDGSDEEERSDESDREERAGESDKEEGRDKIVDQSHVEDEMDESELRDDVEVEEAKDDGEVIRDEGAREEIVDLTGDDDPGSLDARVVVIDDGDGDRAREESDFDSGEFACLLLYCMTVCNVLLFLCFAAIAPYEPWWGNEPEPGYSSEDERRVGELIERTASRNAITNSRVVQELIAGYEHLIEAGNLDELPERTQFAIMLERSQRVRGPFSRQSFSHVLFVQTTFVCAAKFESKISARWLDIVHGDGHGGFAVRGKQTE